MGNANQKPAKELSLKGIFKFIIGATVLLFFVTSGILTVGRGHLLLGVMFFILSGSTFIPHSYLRVTQPLKWVIIIFLYIVLAGISGRDIKPEEPKYERYNLLQEFKISSGEDTFLMTVKEVQQESNIVVQDKTVTTSGVFLIVKTEIENLGSQSVDFKFAKDPELRDGENRLYSLYGASIPAGKLNPNVAKEISYVFEIPKDATELKFIVRDRTKAIKLINLSDVN